MRGTSRSRQPNSSALQTTVLIHTSCRRKSGRKSELDEERKEWLEVSNSDWFPSAFSSPSTLFESECRLQSRRVRILIINSSWIQQPIDCPFLFLLTRLCMLSWRSCTR